MTRRSMLTPIAIALTWLLLAVPASNVAAQQADVDGVKAASRAFYAALSTLDDGAAMEKVWAHTPYVTYVGPGSKSVMVGWDAQRKYWTALNKRTERRKVALSDQHIHVNGNLAWEMGQESGSLKYKNGATPKIDFLVTNVYEKIGGRWLMVSHHVQPKPR